MREITIHEATDPRGARVHTRLAAEPGQLVLKVASEVLPLPDGALEAVMRRYGKPLEKDVAEASVVERLDLGDGRALVRFRFMARYDVIARDYLAFYTPEAEPACELATSVSAILDHLARSLAAASSGAP